MIPRIERPETISPFPITTNRIEAEWIMRPALGPGGRIFYRRYDGRYFWNKDRPDITKPVFASRSFMINSPLKAYFDFTNRCNLQCLHYITSSSPYADISTELPTPRILELTSELADIGVLEVATARLTLCRGVDEELPTLFKDIASTGALTAKIAVVKEVGRAATETGRHLLGFTPDESAVEKLMSLGRECGLAVQLSADDFPVTVDKANDPKLRDLERQNCGAGFESCYISPNGELQSCVTMPNLAFGLLHTESFRTAWQGKLAEEFRRLANDSQERRLCDVFCSQHPKNLADSV